MHLLTTIACNGATAGEKKIRKLVDGAGLYLWVYANGAKYWRFRYWHLGKEKSVSLGVYPEISLKEARERAQIERERVKAKLDPGAERKAQKLREQVNAGNTFQSVSERWWEKNVSMRSPRYFANLQARFNNNLFPYIGSRPINAISRAELLGVLQKIEARGAPDQARRVLRECGQVFQYALDLELCTANPADRLNKALKPHEKKNQAAVAENEVPDLMRAIAGYDKIGDRVTMLALILLAYTFVRTQELIGAKWEEFDLDAGGWMVPKMRMKMRIEHFVPLATQSVTILTELKELSRGSVFVFPGRNRDRPMSNNTLLFALYRLGYKGKMTGHGFRAVASSILNGAGFDKDAIEHQLAHREKDETRGAYNRHEYVPVRMKMMQFWADYLATFVTPAESAAPIAPAIEA